ncbi:hypothetical protein NESM_000119100 [Novymonas esmeraldas]|uniref:Uncharacterized protein n=1 Tax=Novymonas esmeraldas TaxID=1808958 RepID=A0AAW0F4P3_9TRYP
MALSGLLRRASSSCCFAAPLLTGARLYRVGLSRPSSVAALALSGSTALTSSSVVPATVASAVRESRHGYARSRNPHDSHTEELGNTFFDVQDVDADRLTHFYWDSSDDADAPYDVSWLVNGAGEGEAGDEWAGESLAFVDARDQPLLDDEYLR